MESQQNEIVSAGVLVRPRFCRKIPESKSAPETPKVTSICNFRSFHETPFQQYSNDAVHNVASGTCNSLMQNSRYANAGFSILNNFLSINDNNILERIRQNKKYEVITESGLQSWLAQKELQKLLSKKACNSSLILLNFDTVFADNFEKIESLLKIEQKSGIQFLNELLTMIQESDMLTRITFLKELTAKKIHLRLAKLLSEFMKSNDQEVSEVIFEYFGHFIRQDFTLLPEILEYKSDLHHESIHDQLPYWFEEKRGFAVESLLEFLKIPHFVNIEPELINYISEDILSCFTKRVLRRLRRTGFEAHKCLYKFLLRLHLELFRQRRKYFIEALLKNPLFMAALGQKSTVHQSSLRAYYLQYTCEFIYWANELGYESGAELAAGLETLRQILSLPRLKLKAIEKDLLFGCFCFLKRSKSEILTSFYQTVAVPAILNLKMSLYDIEYDICDQSAEKSARFEDSVWYDFLNDKEPMIDPEINLSPVLNEFDSEQMIGGSPDDFQIEKLNQSFEIFRTPTSMAKNNMQMGEFESLLPVDHQTEPKNLDFDSLCAFVIKKRGGERETIKNAAKSVSQSNKVAKEACQGGRGLLKRRDRIDREALSRS